MGFTHLHLHTEYSLLDGACQIQRLMDRVAELGQTSVAITDHGSMFGAIDFYRAAQKKGIKPIIGCEVYVATRTRFDKVHELDYSHRHLVLLCENNIGYQNLIALVSRGWTEGFYGKPRVDYELLEQYHEGLIALSACLAGEIPQALLKNDYYEAKRTALRLRDIFGENNFFLELQDHSIPEQKQTNPQIVRIANETGIPLVVTNDCHYLRKEDHEMHHILLCIQTNHTVEDDDTMEFGSEEFYVKSEEEMRSLFPNLPQAFDNTMKIADRCHVEFEFGKIKLPHFDVPDNRDHREYFTDLCYQGLYRRYGQAPSQELIDRLEYELDMISTMGYVDYYLIVYDFIRYAKSVGIPVGPGRGSGAGSLAAYCIGITGIDPMKYNLLFERFLNPERVSMPDFDIDFCYERRQEVIDYVVRKYGHDHVAQIVTFGTMAARGAIRDVGRAMALPYATVDSVAKLVPMELNITLESALVKSKDLLELYQSDEQIKKLIDMARKLEGMPRHASTHAAGVVITEQPVMEYVPLSKNDEAIVTQYPMTTLEELGLLKMDFLGLRTLTVIRDAEKMIQQTQPEFHIDDISVEDKQVFEMLSAGETEGVFQFESAGMRNVLMQLGPESVEDLIAVISLYRPGPMDSIPRYINNRHHPDKMVYLHPRLEPILKVTYGCMVYQEQVMQVFRELAGYSLGRADIVRRAMAKKKADVMERERKIFVHGLEENGKCIVEGCLRRGVDEASAMRIVAEMESFASYAFNKSHAAAYAVVAYQTAYLRRHYPKEFFAALLTSVLDSTNKVVGYISACQELSLRVLPPSVNESDLGFTAIPGQPEIRFGLLAVKNLGRNLIRQIIEERKNGRFASFYDFCKRLHGRELNRRALESLIYCGALDGLGANRRQMIVAANEVLDSLDEIQRKNIEGQLGFFDAGLSDAEDHGPSLPDLADFTVAERLSMEKDVTGMYISGHPMMEYTDVAKKINAARIGELLESNKEEGASYHDGDRVTVLAVIVSTRTKITKSNATMAFVVVEDTFGSIEMLVFPKTLEQYTSLLREGSVVQINARLSVREDEDVKLICEQVCPVPTLEETSVPKAQEQSTSAVRPAARTAPEGLYLKIPSLQSPEFAKVENLLQIFDGNFPVYLRCADTGKMVRAPRNLWVFPNAVMEEELRRILGEKNVAMLKNF